MKKLLSCAYNMDNCCVELKFTDGSMIAIDTIAVENEVADNTAQMNWIQTLVDRITAKLTEPISVTEASDEDDLPEEFYN